LSRRPGRHQPIRPILSHCPGRCLTQPSDFIAPPPTHAPAPRDQARQSVMTESSQSSATSGALGSSTSGAMGDSVAPTFFAAYAAVNVKQHVSISLSLERPNYSK